MVNEKIARAKRIVARFNWDEFKEFEKWMGKKRDKMWEAERMKRRKEREESIKALAPGTEVVFTDSRHDFGGEIGKIVRHLERNSTRTAVDFGKDIGIWHIPRRSLSSDISKEKIKGIKVCKNLSGVLNKELAKI